MASDNTLDNVRVNVDNKNPLYNAYVEMDSIKSKYYKIRDFSLINVTMKDTIWTNKFKLNDRNGSQSSRDSSGYGSGNESDGNNRGGYYK